ncbi:DUF2570 domain-containing protein [Citrobacter freundii]|jgi:hypothetical protein|uniref:DUF2570 domain-containing protein n=1 Tax=Citrobacter europaeus TaxID=1914243 RepID=UPI0018FF8D51|nr:DUF2570 domain-containing protein [Citrobacter europaeus]MBJ8823585.1 DUF2570 domain-containing protein [Citrobacter freundii]MDT7086251.1 DUF2570 domain-containing protein [Citrobacter europaeus]
MNISLKSLIVPGVILLLILASWLSYANYKDEKKRADDAELSATNAVTITDNVLRTIKITNVVLETNQYAKQQIALESQRTQADIKVAVANDDCARRPVPDAAADRLRQYADSLREGSSGTSPGKPHG